MSVRKLRAAWWVDFTWKGTRYRKRSVVNTRVGALEYEAILRGRLARSEPLEFSPRPVVRFSEFATNWFDTYVKTNNRRSTAYSRECVLRHYLVPTFGSLSLDQITTAHLEQYKAARQAEGLAPKTINGHLGCLHAALAVAKEWGLLDAVPRTKWLKVPPVADNFLSPDECGRLLAAADNPLWHEMILCGLRTGLRFSELAGLAWSDIDFARNTIAVRHAAVLGVIGPTKNNKSRYVPMARDLRELLVGRCGTSGLVFPGPGGAPLSVMPASRELHRVCKVAGIRHVGWHALRHTFASQLVVRGIPIRVVQILLGHSSVQMTERYAHLAPSSLQEAVLVLDPERLPRQRAVNAAHLEGSPSVPVCEKNG